MMAGRCFYFFFQNEMNVLRNLVPLTHLVGVFLSAVAFLYYSFFFFNVLTVALSLAHGHLQGQGV